MFVGVVDSGINPYHEQFRDSEARLPPWLVDATTGKAPVPLLLSPRGSFEERRHADNAVWKDVEGGKLYWFVGTRLLAISFDQAPRSARILDDDVIGGHGTGVASAVRFVSPGAWIVMVQAGAELAEQGEAPLSDLHEAVEGVRWLARQPWVDIVSLSYISPGNIPLLWETAGYPEATRSLVAAGKVYVNSGGNYPTPGVMSGASGPPWAISVGAAENVTHGADPDTTKIGIDVVANATQWLAAHEASEYRWKSGTSFSAPTVAGALAQGLLELRAHYGYEGLESGSLCACGGLNVTAGGLRDALNRSAVYWNTTDYDGTRPVGSDDPVFRVLEATIPIGPAPWLQMGWGYVGQDSWVTIAQALEGHPPPQKPPEARQYMALQQQLREEYWSLNPFGPAPSPILPPR